MVDINVMGVVHVTEVFSPLMSFKQRDGNTVNAVAIVGDLTLAHMSPYNATMFAVIEYSENVRQELEYSNIKISVLCPAWLKRNVHSTQDGVLSLAQSDSEFTDSPFYPMYKQLIDNGMSTEDFAALALPSYCCREIICL
jgi:short-subunit dehydrogenase